ncbi:MAG: alpha/beta hydrolase, partial [Clostridia bacterium]|nr:alpha/beta hydrolase [Clostridia bacterium]
VRSLLQRLNVSSAVFVGHSFGGRVAIELAFSSPNIVDKLVLIDSAGCKPRRHFDYYFKIFTHKLLKKMGFKGLKGSKDYQGLSPVMRQTFKNVVSFYQDGELPHISCKTAIFWGKHDKETPAYMAKRLNHRIKNSNLFWLDGGHFAYMDDFFRFLSVLLAFLKE